MSISEQPSICEWFAMCDRSATSTRRHPILGDVPICRRCNEYVEAIDAHLERTSDAHR